MVPSVMVGGTTVSVSGGGDMVHRISVARPAVKDRGRAEKMCVWKAVVKIELTEGPRLALNVRT
jgi:hypothetical protein